VVTGIDVLLTQRRQEDAPRPPADTGVLPRRTVIESSGRMAPNGRSSTGMVLGGFAADQQDGGGSWERRINLTYAFRPLR
jgi:hypothetical protein